MPDLDHRQPICVAIESHSKPVNMTPSRNGVIVRLTEDRLVTGDVWGCPSCHLQIIDRLSFGNPIERWEGEVFDHLERRLQSMGPNVQVGYPERNEVYGYSE